MERFDVAVIGGGLLGCFAARELSRWKLNILLIEAREDVCTGISRANTAIVYPGYDHKPGTLKAEMTVHANESFDRLCAELDVPFSRCGSLMLSRGERADAVLRNKFRWGQENRVPGIRLLNAEEAQRLEPALGPGISSALWAPTAGTVNPWQLGIAACENAAANGVTLKLRSELSGMRREDGAYVLETEAGAFSARAVINCAGIAADRIQRLLFPTRIRVLPTAGDYLVLDRHVSGRPVHILQFELEEKEKGLTIVPTVEGSLLLGPTERENRGNCATDEDGLRTVRELAKRCLPSLDTGNTVRSFAALRPNPVLPDGSSIRSFVIDHPSERFWSLIGIKTPGLTCARELGFYVAERAAEELGAETNLDFNPVRQGIRRAHALSFEQRKKLTEQNPDYGEIVCCCEDVTRAEVIEAIRRGAVTVDGVKRRVGTSMGPCQGARCEQKITELLSSVLGIPVSAVNKDGPGSQIVRDSDDGL